MTIRGGGRPRRYVGRNRPDDADSPARPVVDAGWDDEPYTAPTYDDDVSGVRLPAYEPRRAYGSARWYQNNVLRFVVFAVVLVALVLGTLGFVVRPMVMTAVTNWAAENPTALSLPFVADIVRGELGSAATEPMDRNDKSPITFMVPRGATPRQIGEALVQAGLVREARAFVFEAIEQDATSSFVAGPHVVNKSMTPDQIIAALTTNPPPPPKVTVTFREGLRIEQMVAKLEDVEANPAKYSKDPNVKLTLDIARFDELATHPPESLVAKYTWLKLPSGASLEGFLFPATYDLAPDTTADDLIVQLLDSFAKNAPPDLLKLSPEQLYKTVQLASIVETEAKVNAERATIAGVYTNRLNPKLWPTGLLNADPTLNYANDSVWLQSHPLADWVSYSFWDRIQATNLSQVKFPGALQQYNTYAVKGLPPTPICSPSLASIQAAMKPDTTTGYLYFVAKNDGSGEHAFAKTAAEFQALLKKYGYTQ